MGISALPMTSICSSPPRSIRQRFFLLPGGEVKIDHFQVSL
jgi:hypothetical protein